MAAHERIAGGMLWHVRPSLPGFDTFTGERQSLAFDDDVLGLASRTPGGLLRVPRLCAEGTVKPRSREASAPQTPDRGRPGAARCLRPASPSPPGRPRAVPGRLCLTP